MSTSEPENKFPPNGVSWYIWIECVPTQILMPLFIVLIGIICQSLIAYFITFPVEPPSTEAMTKKHQVSQASTVTANPQLTQREINSHCGCCSACKNSDCGRGTAYCLMVWQIISMTVILILDLVGFFEWKESEYIDEIYDSETWNNYQCFSARIVISSNYSLCVLNFIAMVINPDWHDNFRIAWNIATGVFFFCYIIWLIMYGLVGALTYIWITIFIVGPAVAVYVCCKNCKDSSPLCHQCCIQIYFPIVLMFFVGVLALSMINIFEGMDYWKAFENVLLERRWEDYYEELDGESVFRGITAFLG